MSTITLLEFSIGTGGDDAFLQLRDLQLQYLNKLHDAVAVPVQNPRKSAHGSREVKRTG
jgi:hypothetical protein